MLLAVDTRAVQVFEGFSGAEVFSHLRFLYPHDHPILLDGTESSLGKLSGVDRESRIVVLEVSGERPRGLAGIAWIVDRLLAPDGCPWDRAQTHHTLKRHLIDESYELIEAIDNDQPHEMVEELGDVLLQPFMHTQIAKARGEFDIDAVAEVLGQKLYRRHPHVFADVEAETSDEVLRNWDDIKESEKNGTQRSVLGGVPDSLPALLQAYEISVRAARKGFEWASIDQVWEKSQEETEELKSAVDAGDMDAALDELGDLLFTIVNIARWLGVEPEDALRRMLRRFRQRFYWIEKNAGKPLVDLSGDEWRNLWDRAKRAGGTDAESGTNKGQES